MSGVSRARRERLQRDFISDAGELSEEAGSGGNSGGRREQSLDNLEIRANIWVVSRSNYAAKTKSQLKSAELAELLLSSGLESDRW